MPKYNWNKHRKKKIKSERLRGLSAGFAIIDEMDWGVSDHMFINPRAFDQMLAMQVRDNISRELRTVLQRGIAARPDSIISAAHEAMTDTVERGIITSYRLNRPRADEYYNYALDVEVTLPNQSIEMINVTLSI